jgi:hypothetical protein
LQLLLEKRYENKTKKKKKKQSLVGWLASVLRRTRHRMRGSSKAEAFAYLLQLHWNFTQDWQVLQR